MPMRKPIAGLLLLVILLMQASPALAEATPLQVYYAGSQDSVWNALKLAGFDLTQDLSTTDVIFLNGVIPDPAEIAAQVKAGAGLVMILGAQVTSLELAPLLGPQPELELRSEAVSLQVPEDISDVGNDEIVSDILWTSAPQVRERMVINGLQITPLITSYESGEILLGETTFGNGKIFIFSAFLDSANPQIQEWPYYNYFIYNLAVRAAGQQPQTFGAYPASPLPHARERLFLYIAMAVLVLITWGIYFLVRRYSKAHPEALDSLVAKKQAFVKREANTDWEQIGFHRSIGGFMFALMSGLVLFIPMVAYQNFILPVYILPSAQAMGMWGRVSAMFPLVWSLFDMGTSVSHMKFFSEYRVKNPQRAIQYAQFYVWWQALTGAIQVAMVVTFASAFMPETAYAVLIWSIVTHAMIQIPGFYRVFTDSLSAYQRADYNQILDIAMTMVIPMIVQPIVISLMVWWGKNNPVFGPAMGGLLGLGVSAYVMEFVSFWFGWWLYQRVGYNAKLLFMAHFDKDVAVQSLKYGFFLFLSGLFGGLGSSLMVTVIQPRLLNTNEVLGNLSMAATFPFAYTVLQTLTATVLPAISESVTNGRKILGQFYASMSYKYGGFVSAFICAILLSVADRFILGSSGRDFERAAVYVVPLLLIASLNFASWVGDVVMYALKTRLLMIFAMLDLMLNIGVTYLLVDRWQVKALIYVPLFTLLVKIFLAYYINHRYCVPQRFYFWQTIGAPALAGLFHYLWLRWFTGLIWQHDEITSIIILAIGLLFTFPIYGFLYGLFGGWDDNTLEQFGRGANLSSFMRPMTRLFYQSTRLGARLSPLHGKFPISNFVAASEEARSLTDEKVALI
jgi:O-antigen/teichoic acid export membrane protein